MEYKLILKKIYNNLSPEEEILFNKWHEESESHRAYFEKVKNNLNREPQVVDPEKGWESIEKQISPPVKKYYWKIATAASILLIIGLSLLYLITNTPTQQQLTADNITPGTSKAILTLEDGSNIYLKKGTYYKAENISSDGEEVVYAGNSTNIEQVKFNYLTIPKGGQFHLKLPDGTRVWLNSDSKIKYPTEFIDGRVRKVELIYGEAYFEVSPSTEHKGSKFDVITQMQTVEVLGTEFNIKAYRDEQYIYTTLIEGKVMIDNGHVKKVLKPDQQSTIDIRNNDIKVATIDVYDVISWKKGVFSFKEKTLYDITKVLSRWYDVTFVFEDQNIKNTKFNGVLDKKQSISTILSILKTSNNIDYEIKNRTIVIK